MPGDASYSRVEGEVLAHGKEIATLKAEVAELKRWRTSQSGLIYHVVTWALMLAGLIVARLWGN
jgi:hypothetical protein